MKTRDFIFDLGGSNAHLSWKLLPAILDARAILGAAQNPEVKVVPPANTEAAAVHGVFGIRTFFVGEEMFLGKERHGQVEEGLCHARGDS